MTKVAIVDYGLANIRSVVNAVSCFEAEITVAETGVALADADRIVLPGVGSFDAGMRGLRTRGHDEALQSMVIERGRPFLGICLGLQFLMEGSEEGRETGLSWFPGVVKRFPTGAGTPKIPHMGWDTVERRNGSDDRLFRDLVPPFDFYFVHSYYVPDEGDARAATTAVCEHGLEFIAALERDNVFAVQFHPEKSQLAGMKMLEAFVKGPF